MTKEEFCNIRTFVLRPKEVGVAHRALQGSPVWCTDAEAEGAAAVWEPARSSVGLEEGEEIRSEVTGVQVLGGPLRCEI